MPDSNPEFSGGERRITSRGTIPTKDVVPSPLLSYRQQWLTGKRVEYVACHYGQIAGARCENQLDRDETRETTVKVSATVVVNVETDRSPVVIHYFYLHKL